MVKRNREPSPLRALGLGQRAMRLGLREKSVRKVRIAQGLIRDACSEILRRAENGSWDLDDGRAEVEDQRTLDLFEKVVAADEAKHNAACRVASDAWTQAKEGRGDR